MTGIIFLLNITYAPYIHKYIDVLNDSDKKFEVIYWDRINKPDAPDAWNTHVFNYESDLSKNKFSKLADFLRFRKFVKNILKRRKYKKLIILTTLTGVSLVDELLKDYNGKYILDIRDYTFEKVPIYKSIVSRLVKGSAFTVISSEGFKNFLPKSNKYVIAHNFSYYDLDAFSTEKKASKSVTHPLNLGFVGSIRHYNLDTEMIGIFNDDNKFHLTYHGDGPTYKKLKNYCYENNYNVKFTGRFDIRQKYDLIEDIDIINAYYSEEKFANLYAISNKYYDALIYRKPILVNSNVFIGQKVKNNKLGFAIDIKEEDIKSKLYNDYLNFDFSEFNERCQSEMQKILLDDQKYIERVYEFIK